MGLHGLEQGYLYLFHLSIFLFSVLVSSRFHTKTRYAFHFYVMRATFPARLFLIIWIILIIGDEATYYVIEVHIL
jgi:hypothetical protein